MTVYCVVYTEGNGWYSESIWTTRELAEAELEKQLACAEYGQWGISERELDSNSPEREPEWRTRKQCLSA